MNIPSISLLQYFVLSDSGVVVASCNRLGGWAEVAEHANVLESSFALLVRIYRLEHLDEALFCAVVLAKKNQRGCTSVSVM